MKSLNTKRIILYGLLTSLFLFCTGCGKSLEDRTTSGVVYYNPNATEEPEQTEETESGEDMGDLYLILSNNSAEETLRLYRYANSMEYQYHYALSTRFLDKYGGYASVTEFTPGRAVIVGDVDLSGKLTQVQISDAVWEYENVSRFSIDEDRGLFQIADTKYRLEEETFAFSDDEEIGFADITKSDQLTIVGIGKQILAVMVTTGHGTLELSNTELFEGSFLQLNTNIFAEITPDMTMELPEGTYMLTVANDGWGGSCDVTVTRGGTTVVDLDSIKGEGPQYGTILFTVDVEGTVIIVDGTQIDYSQPQTLKYGRHTLTVQADGYEEWTKYLYVNSEEATIEISLEEEDTAGSSEEEEINSETEENTENNTEEDTNSSTDTDLMKDYLSTLTELLGSI